MKSLRKNEVIAELSGILLPMTIDSGVEMTVVPEEAVQESKFTGETTMFERITGEGKTGKNWLT